MMLYLFMMVVISSMVFQHTMAFPETIVRCKSDWDLCRDQSDCCPGFVCTTWGPSLTRCKREGNTQCGRRGSDCGLFSWCCQGFTCVQMKGKFECTNQI